MLLPLLLRGRRNEDTSESYGVGLKIDRRVILVFLWVFRSFSTFFFFFFCFSSTFTSRYFCYLVVCFRFVIIKSLRWNQDYIQSNTFVYCSGITWQATSSTIDGSEIVVRREHPQGT